SLSPKTRSPSISRSYLLDDTGHSFHDVEQLGLGERELDHLGPELSQRPIVASVEVVRLVLVAELVDEEGVHPDAPGRVIEEPPALAGEVDGQGALAVSASERPREVIGD